MTPKILVFAGSTRSGAFSGKSADLAHKELAVQGADVTRISLADYLLPLMDEDLEAEKGVPQNAVNLAALFDAHDAVLIATPEYNGSIPPLLKNTIDWISRVSKIDGRPVRPFNGKVMALCSSSAGHFAGIRSGAHLRAVLSHIQADVIAPQVSVPNGGSAFDEDGAFKDDRLRKGMERLCRTLIDHAGSMSPRLGG